MKETFLAWIDSVTTWAKADIASWHASSTFNIFGWIIEKFQAMGWMAGMVIGTIVLLVVFAAIFSPDKLDNEPRKRPGMD